MQKKFLVFLIAAMSFSSPFYPVHATSTEATSEITSINDGNVVDIVLSSEKDEINWTVNGTSALGFKVVWSKNENPTYPTREGDKYHYFSDPNKTADTLTAFAGSGTYYARVCEYLGGACGVYSNQVSVELLDEESEAQCTDEYDPVCGIDGKTYTNKCTLEALGVAKMYSGECHGAGACQGGGSYYCGELEIQCIKAPCDPVKISYYSECELNLAGAKLLYAGKCREDNVESIDLASDGANISWEVQGNSPKGFKVVWSKNENPTYPTREGDKYHYFSDPNKTADTLTAFAGSGTYYARVCEYLGGACGVYSNQVSVKLEDTDSIVCTMEYEPVCGQDGKTYSNKCVASANGVEKKYYGGCKKDEEIERIENKAQLLSKNKLDDILSELQELRSLVREQQNEIKYLHNLMDNVSQVTSEMQNSINSFITYGVDDNTKRLGEGERAAVMYSYKQAFGKLPGNEDELSDAIKIANGRFPAHTSEEAEKAAKERFQQIYKRIADMDNPEDKAAITVMAYGLRQKAENRNLDSEKNGIKIFQNIYGKVPSTTEEWNIMQAITYSGATRGVDSDGDLLTDAREEELGTDPNNVDSDNDGFWDGVEVANGFDPLKE